jgi:hypothetical protein
MWTYRVLLVLAMLRGVSQDDSTEGGGPCSLIFVAISPTVDQLCGKTLCLRNVSKQIIILLKIAPVGDACIRTIYDLRFGICRYVNELDINEILTIT